MARPIAEKAAADAVLNVGVHEEGGENAGKSVEIYLASVGLSAGAPWCAAFSYYRLKAAAKALGLSLPAWVPKSGYVPDWKNAARENHLWVPVKDARDGKQAVRAGDLVLFYFAAKERVAHMGIVTGTWEGGVLTVEGNTSDGSGVNRDGDGVYARRRSWGSLGAGGGFVRVNA